MAEFDLNDPRLTAFALGELPEHERLEVERLLEESAEARAALVEIQETIDLVKDELAAEPVPALTSTQRRAIEAQLEATQPTATQPVTVAIGRSTEAASLSWRWLSLGLTAAALVGIALVLPRGARHDELGSSLASQKNEMQANRLNKLSELEVTLNEAGRTQLGRSFTNAVTADEGSKINSLERAYQEHVRGDANATLKQSGLKQGDSDKMELRSQLASREVAKDQQPDSKNDAAFGVLTDAAGTRAGKAVADDKPSAKPTPSGDVVATRRAVVKSEVASGPIPGPSAAGGAAPEAPARADLAKGKQVASSAPTNGERMRALNESKKAVDRLEDESRPAEGKPAADARSFQIAVGKKMNAREAGAAHSDAAPGSAAGLDRGRGDGPAKGAAEKAIKPVARTTVFEEGEVAEATVDRQLALRDSERKKRDEKLAAPIESLQKESREQAPNLEAYEAITENEFLVPQDSPLSTFSIDVDSASYANMRRFLTQGQLPPANAIRVEELINYFSYQYAQPADGQPFSVLADAAPCPWSKDHYIARIGLKARDIDKAKRPPTNLVFLIDVSGSMGTPNKLPLVKRGMSLLVEEMTEIDRISIVTYAGDAGLKLEPTTGNEQARIMGVIDGLNAGGSTNGAAGINLAYEQALRHFNKEAANRVILCTDGDFNVGVSSDSELVKLIEAQAKTGVYLSIFGFGMGNLKDSKLEKLADKGNGHYGYIDDLNEARKVFNEELVGTLYTVAKDVKLQVEFNPLTVGAYRLIGYENRTLAAQDFNDDTKDAGEIGAGHTVTALYEIVPVGKWPKPSNVDPLKYAAADKAGAERKLADVKEGAKKVPADVADDLFTVKLRYKQPDAETSVKTIDYVVDDIAGKKVVPNGDLMWAASVANFGMQLRHSKHAGQWKLEDIAETASGLVGEDRSGRRAEFVDLVKKAATLKGGRP